MLLRGVNAWAPLEAKVQIAHFGKLILDRARLFLPTVAALAAPRIGASRNRTAPGAVRAGVGKPQRKNTLEVSVSCWPQLGRGVLAIGLEARRDGREERAQLGSERRYRTDNDDRYQGGDQSIFDCRNSGLVLDKLGKQ
jgi:hypothetical protein